jgi:hypothetical protein
MEKKQILGILIAFCMSVAMIILSEAVAKNIVNDYMSIKISLMVSFALGLIFFAALCKLGIV